MPDLLRRHLLWTGALAPLALALPSPARAKVPPAPAGLSAGSTAEQATAALVAFRISCPSVQRRTDTSGLTQGADWTESCTAAKSW